MEEELQRHRVYKAMHRLRTFFGIERSLFFLTCGAAVVSFSLFNSLLASLTVLLSGMALSYWITSTDPAFLRILGAAGRAKTRYDAAKQQFPNVEIR